MSFLNKCSAFSLFAFIGILILISLGNWQIYRLQWKENLISTLQKRSECPPLSNEELETFSLSDLKNFEFAPAFVEGHYLYELEFQLLGRTYKGQAGYHVITPFQLKTKKILLIDRGWVPFGVQSITRPTGLLKIKGIIRLNSEKNLFTPDNNFSTYELYSILPSEIETQTSLKGLLPFYLCATDTTPPNVFPVSLPAPFKLRNFHLAYALTWYTLALGLGIIYFFFKRKNNLQK